MHAGTGVLAVVGSVCMTLALVLAWCLAGVRSSRFVKRCFPNPQSPYSGTAREPAMSISWRRLFIGVNLRGPTRCSHEWGRVRAPQPSVNSSRTASVRQSRIGFPRAARRWIVQCL